MIPRIDPFYYDQPPLLFVDELKKPFYQKKPDGFGKRSIRAGEANADGIYLDCADFDGAEVLESAYFEFGRFTDLVGISGKRYPVSLKKRATECFEAYDIEVREDGCTVYSADTEGVRRAIIYILDELMRREGAFLPIGTVKRKPVIKTRITRGFFSPTNRPPKNGDELSDDIDYYPEEYLNRLMHDGTNALWIYTSFKALLKSKYFPEFGEGSEKRIEKLRTVVKKCAKYGIKVFVFAIEPMNLSPALAKAHPEVLGAQPQAGVAYPFCPMSEVGRAYILEATEKLFRLVPDLGGYMDITEGERVTSCAAAATFKTCPRCGKKHIGAALADTVNLIKEGIRRAGTGAEFISWTYGHRLWKFDDIREYVRGADSDIALMQNFDDMGYDVQLGKMREAVDYWLSYVGPSDLFKITAAEAKAHGKKMFAKMQVCCSHELATVPYIPTPGLVFEKYKGAFEYNVVGVLQCWYFGNYPSIMSKAAGELSFMSDFSDKAGFLESLAATYYGESMAADIRRAWEKFEDGYKNYPMNIMFSYYGPMHDGVVWDLALLPRDNMLPRTWKLLDPPDGDRIKECLWEGHTVDEAITLTDMIKTSWREGMKLLPLSSDDEMVSIASALDLLFDSGNNILRFYGLRRELGLGIGDPFEKLAAMRDIVLREIENSESMIPLCEADVRLGYHSEAEGFKFFPKKLRARIEKLKTLLETEFKLVEERINDGLAPLEFYLGKKDGEAYPDSYMLHGVPVTEAEWCDIDGGNRFRVSYDDENIYVQIDSSSDKNCKLSFEFEPLMPSPGICFDPDGNVKLFDEACSHHSVFGEKIERELSKYTVKAEKKDGEGALYTVTADRKACGWTENRPLRMYVSVADTYYWHESTDDPSDSKLAKWDEIPSLFGWLLV